MKLSGITDQVAKVPQEEAAEQMDTDRGEDTGAEIGAVTEEAVEEDIPGEDIKTADMATEIATLEIKTVDIAIETEGDIVQTKIVEDPEVMARDSTMTTFIVTVNIVTVHVAVK